MRKTFAIILLVIALFFAYSLGKRAIPPVSYKTSPISPPIPERAVAPTEEISEPSEEGGSLSERLVIKTGQLSLLVADVRRAVEEITKFAEDEEGFVLSADVHKVRPESEKLIGIVKIKVPSEKFTQIFNRLKNFGLKVTSENVSGQDVTEEYTDLQSQLRNLEAAESQLLDLMKRAGKVTEILEVQKELVRTREQIERIKGRVKFLTESAEMGTITVNLATEEEELPIVEEGWRPRKIARSALRTLVSFWQRIGNLVIWSTIFFSPLILLGGIIFVVRKVRRKT